MSTTMTIFVVCLVIAILMALGYLAACAGAGRWLKLAEWLVQTECAHKHGRLLAIGFDGESVYECARCGKHVRKPL